MKYILILAIFLSSCYSSKKASTQIDKAIYSFPEISIKKLRDKFPCIPDTFKIKSDSSEYKRWKKQLDETIAFYDSLLNNVEPQVIFEKDLSDSMKVVVLLANNEKLNTKISYLERTLTKLISVKPPVIHDTIPIKDSAEVYLTKLEIAKEKNVNEKLANENAVLKRKIAQKNKEIWIGRLFFLLIILWLLFRLYKSITTIKFKR